MKKTPLYYLIVLLLGGLYFACNGNNPTDEDRTQDTPPKDKTGDNNEDPSLQAQRAQAAQQAAENAQTLQATAEACKTAQDIAQQVRQTADQAAKEVETKAKAINQTEKARKEALAAYLKAIEQGSQNIKEQVNSMEKLRGKTNTNKYHSFQDYKGRIVAEVDNFNDTIKEGSDVSKQLADALEAAKNAKKELETAIEEAATTRKAAQAAEQAASKAVDALNKKIKDAESSTT